MAVLDSFLPAGLLDTFEALQQSAYDRTCAVLEATAVQDPDTYEHTETFEPKTGSLPCAVEPASASQRQAAGQLETVETVVVKLDYIEGVLVTDRIALTTGEVYEVVYPEDVHMMNRWLHVLAARRINEGL